MKIFLISDNNDTLLGMRFAGIEGVIVHDKNTAIEKIIEITADKDCGVILITSKLKNQCNDFLSDFMEKNPIPLFQEIPDRHGEQREGSSILEFIEHSIGLKLGNTGKDNKNMSKDEKDTELT
ncbi:MAG: hypothetical protein A2Y17_08915 [Clostridiales bacterium GWF2_38_85]|nr:MAG: hypothetical protein A2Y17_08915 [Clostridiales bacterium GWF2_38_85]HBL83683.1 ATP synthase subunit F [Clostridiales bacterium]